MQKFNAEKGLLNYLMTQIEWFAKIDGPKEDNRIMSPSQSFSIYFATH